MILWTVDSFFEHQATSIHASLPNVLLKNHPGPLDSFLMFHIEWFRLILRALNNNIRGVHLLWKLKRTLFKKKTLVCLKFAKINNADNYL